MEHENKIAQSPRLHSHSVSPARESQLRAARPTRDPCQVTRIIGPALSPNLLAWLDSARHSARPRVAGCPCPRAPRRPPPSPPAPEPSTRECGGSTPPPARNERAMARPSGLAWDRYARRRSSRIKRRLQRSPSSPRATPFSAARSRRRSRISNARASGCLASAPLPGLEFPTDVLLDLDGDGTMMKIDYVADANNPVAVDDDYSATITVHNSQ